MSLRVLVVDDDASVRRLLSVSLPLSADVEVIGEACDGLEAIDKARETDPDLIILDHMMPRLTGGDAIPGLVSACPNGEIVLFSAYLDAPAVHSRLSSLARDYQLESIPKGSLEDLEAAVGQIAERRAGRSG